VEIMIVVVIIGLLAAIAIPAFQRVRKNAQSAHFASDMRTFSQQLEIFIFESGEFPEDSSSGQIPSGFEEYIRASDWNAGPMIGGVYDVEFDSYGVTSAVGAHGYTIPDTDLTEFDRKFDDGDLSTGYFRQLDSDRYYYVLAQ